MMFDMLACRVLLAPAPHHCSAIASSAYGCAAYPRMQTGNERVELNGHRQQTDFVGAEDANGLRQVNVLAKERTQPGNIHVVAQFAGVRSAPFEIEATAPVP
jgi:hypothetical protein